MFAATFAFETVENALNIPRRETMKAVSLFLQLILNGNYFVALILHSRAVYRVSAGKRLILPVRNVNKYFLLKTIYVYFFCV